MERQRNERRNDSIEQSFIAVKDEDVSQKHLAVAGKGLHCCRGHRLPMYLYTEVGLVGRRSGGGGFLFGDGLCTRRR